MREKPRVFITRRIPNDALTMIKNMCEYTLWDSEGDPIPRGLLLDSVAESEGILSMLTDRIDREVFAKAPRLRIVSNMAVGFDNIDLASATQHGIAVTNTPDVLTETTADLTFALLLATARRLVEASTYLRAGQWRTWAPLLLAGQDVYGKVLGIVGMGRIGSAVARRARGFGMTVCYTGREPKPSTETESASYVTLENLLQISDYVCIQTPLTERTKHLIGERELALMKPTAVLINTARGAIVDTDALCKALREGQIWAAGLDVYESEPISANHSLLELPNVVALPHIGSASVETRTRMAMVAAHNLIAGVTGQTPPNQIC